MGAAVMLGAVLLVGMAGTTWGLLTARAQRDRAERQKVKAQFISGSMVRMLEGVSPGVALGRDTTILREMMDRVATWIENGEFKSNPEAEVWLRQAIGSIYTEIAEFESAERMLTGAYTLAKSAESADESELALIPLSLAKLRSQQGRHEEVLTLCEEASTILDDCTSPDPDIVLECISTKGEAFIRVGRLVEAEAIIQQYLNEREGSDTDTRLAPVLHNLAYVRGSLGRPSEAEPLYEQSLLIWQRLHQGDHPNTATCLTNLARLRRELDRPNEAEPLLRQALDMYGRVYSGDHPNTAACLGELALACRDLGRFAEAESLGQQALAMYRRVLGDEHPTSLEWMNVVGNLLRENLHKPAEAEVLYRQILASSQVGDESYLAALNNLGMALRGQGKLPEAEQFLREALSGARARYGDDPKTLMVLRNIGALYRIQHKVLEAESVYREVLDIQRRRLGVGHPDTLRSQRNFGRFLADVGKPDEAEPLLRDALEKSRTIDGTARDAVTAEMLADLGRVLNMGGGCAPAEPLLRECIAIRDGLFPDGHAQAWRRHSARSLLGASLAGQGRFAEAEPLLVDAFEAMKDDPNVRPGTFVDHARDAMDRVAALYEAWEQAAPGNGYATRAAEWREKLQRYDEQRESESSGPR